MAGGQPAIFSALVLILLVACSLVDATCNIGQYQYPDIPQFSGAIMLNWVNNGNPSSHNWVVTPCAAVPSNYNGADPCVDTASQATLSGYISEYTGAYGSCETTWGTLQSVTAGDNHLIMEIAEKATANHPEWTATITLVCGSTPQLASIGDVIVVGANADMLAFNFTFSTSSVCSGTPPPPTTRAPSPSTLPPVLPPYFQGQFTEYTAYDDTVGPPYVNGVPPAPLVASRGAVYYDWEHRRMIEQRFDYCVNIFPEGGHHFPCTFHNINGVSYLITFNKSSVLPPCCVFGKPWSPPEPAFLRDNVSAALFAQMPWNQGEANWFRVGSIPPPTGPFFYSFNASLSPSQRQVYTSFAFPGISGWVQQDFFNISVVRPDPSVWDLPSICLPLEFLPSCDFFGSNSDSSG